MLRRTASVVAACIALLAFAGPEAARGYGFDLTAANFSGYSGPYVHVDVQLTTPTTADITFTSLTTGGYSFLMLDGSSAALSVNSSSFSVGSVTGTQLAGFNVPTLSVTNPPGTSQVDGWGAFNLVIDSSDGYASGSATISFTITNNAGPWASAADVLAENGDGYTAAAHVGVCTAPCTKAAGALVTGYVATPEPGTVALVGFGLIGLAAAGLHRRRPGA